MSDTFVARISPRARTYTFKHPLINTVFRKPLDPRDATKGWVKVNGEQAEILRKQRIGGSSDPHAPPLFEVMTQEEAMEFQQREMEALGLGTPENPVGGSPAQAAKIRQLEGKVDKLTETNGTILALLTAITKKFDPELAAKLEGASPESVTLDVAPAVTAPPSIHDKQPPAATPPAQASAPAAAAAQPKQRPAASGPQPPAATPQKGQGGGNANKQRPAADPASLTTKLREEGKLPPAPTGDIEDEGGRASADTA